MSIYRKKVDWIKSNWGKSLFSLFLGIVSAYLIIYVISTFGSFHFTFGDSKTSCIPNSNVFWVSKLPIKDINRGDIIAFKSKGLSGYPDGSLFAKYVRGLPGDHVQVKPETGIFVNDVFLSSSFYHENSVVGGRDSMRLDGILKANKYWVMGTGEKSFDSRYWGAIDKEQMIGKAYILF